MFLTVSNDRGGYFEDGLYNEFNSIQSSLIDGLLDDKFFKTGFKTENKHGYIFQMMRNDVGISKCNQKFTKLIKKGLMWMESQALECVPSSQNSCSDIINNQAPLLLDNEKVNNDFPSYRENSVDYMENDSNWQRSTLIRINNLAQHMSEQEKYDLALPLQEKALASKRKMLGDRHQSTLDSVNNLVSLFSRKGKYKEALPLQAELLKTRRETLGGRHPSTLTSIITLALILSEQGQYEKALPLYEEALSVQGDTLGDNHPDTLISINNLPWIDQWIDNCSVLSGKM